MKRQEKIDVLIRENPELWYATRHGVEKELSSKQPLMCCCGKLATGLHERGCAKFRAKVDAETVKRLWGKA